MSDRKKFSFLRNGLMGSSTMPFGTGGLTGLLSGHGHVHAADGSCCDHDHDHSHDHGHHHHHDGCCNHDHESDGEE